MVDVYRTTNTGQYEPVVCQVSDGTIHCGDYTPDTVATIIGTWRKEELPSAQIFYPDGRVVTTGRRIAYFLAVD